jgi:hypothetical protein
VSQRFRAAPHMVEDRLDALEVTRDRSRQRAV